MECYYHPSRESTDTCAICGKSICKECSLDIAGKVYCKDCLEKIVGLSLDANAKKEAPKEEPVRLEKQAPPETKIEMANLTRQPEEAQFSNQKIAEDSPYNIKENIQYEGGLESTYDESNQPQISLHDAIEKNQVPQQPVENVREEYVEPDPIMQEVLREPVQQARNEYDYQKPQAAPADDYIYPDHSYQPQETTARQAVEDKYERYLDDLYFDEEEVPLNEQLARDEEQYGSLTRKEYAPRRAPEQSAPQMAAPQSYAEEDDLDRRIREELERRERGDSLRDRREPIHNIQYEEEKEPFSALDILLTIVLIIVIIIVLFYILYLFKLNATYPTFVDAVFGLRNPGQFINALTH